MTKPKLSDSTIRTLLVFWIIAGNLLVDITGIVPFEFDSGVYWLPEYALRDNLIQNLWHLHTNPPLLNILAGILTQLHIPLLIFHQILFAGLQIVASICFFNFLKQQNIKYSGPITFVLLANPMHLVWFNSYYYPALMFFGSVIVLRILYSPRTDGRKFLLLCGILSTYAMLRASYHPFWILALLLPFSKLISRKQFFDGLLLLLIPLGWYTKNYFQYDFWGASSVSGQNFSAHYPDQLRSQIDNCNSRGRYKWIRRYDGLYDENDPRILRYAGDKLLNDSLTLHNVRTVVISEVYLKETKEHFNLRYTLLTIAYGTFTYFSSPSIDEWCNKTDRAWLWNNTWLIDYFDLPNIKVYAENGKYSEIRLSLFTFIYPIVLLILLFNYRKLSFNEKFILHWTIIVTLIYCTVDPNESSRMRYEIEPFFYFLSLLAIFKYTPKMIRQNGSAGSVFTL